MALAASHWRWLMDSMPPRRYLDQERRVLQRDPDHTAGEFGREEAEQRQAEIDEIDLQQQRRIAHQLDVDLNW